MILEGTPAGCTSVLQSDLLFIFFLKRNVVYGRMQ